MAPNINFMVKAMAQASTVIKGRTAAAFTS